MWCLPGTPVAEYISMSEWWALVGSLAYRWAVPARCPLTIEREALAEVQPAARGLAVVNRLQGLKWASGMWLKDPLVCENVCATMVAPTGVLSVDDLL